MREILYRQAVLAVDVDGDPETGRRVYGRLVPYGVEAKVTTESGRSYYERVEFGAFKRSIRERGDKVKLLVAHDETRLPIGRATHLEERQDGLYGEFLISETSLGNDALTALRDGLVDSFSIGFRSIKSHPEYTDRSRSGLPTTVRTEAALLEVSLTAFPVFAGAKVSGLRSRRSTEVRSISRTEALRRLTAMRTPKEK